MKMPMPSSYGTNSLQLPGRMGAVTALKPPTAPLLEDADNLVPAPRLERKNKEPKQAVRPKRAAFIIGHQAFNKGSEAFS